MKTCSSCGLPCECPRQLLELLCSEEGLYAQCSPGWELRGLVPPGSFLTSIWPHKILYFLNFYKPCLSMAL